VLAASILVTKAIIVRGGIVYVINYLFGSVCFELLLRSASSYVVLFKEQIMRESHNKAI
jgi:hypothetical protein